MPSPDVIERQLVDIDLKGGVNEHTRPEVIDWTKYLTQSDNLAFDEYGVLKKRPGLVRYSTEQEPTGSSIGPMLRGFRTTGGMGAIRLNPNNRNMEFLDLNENEAAFTNKGTLPKYAVERQTISSWGSSDGCDIVSICLTDFYKVLVTRTDEGNGSVERFFSIVLVDRKSDNIVRTYIYSPTPDVDRLKVVAVNGVLHVFCSIRTGGSAFRWQLSVNTPPASGVLTPVTTPLVSSNPIVDACNYNGGSVVLQEGGAMERFDSNFTSVANVGIGAYVAATGLYANGTDLYVAGYTIGNFEVNQHNTSLAVVATSTMPLGGQSGEIRVASFGGFMFAVIYRFGTTLAGPRFPRVQFCKFTMGAAFTVDRTIAGWCEASLPIGLDDGCYVLLSNQMQGNSGVNTLQDDIANSVCLVEVSGGVLDPFGPKRFTPEAVVDQYFATLKANDRENGSYGGPLADGAYPHRPILDGTDLHVATMNQVSTNAASFDWIKLVPGKASTISGHENVYSAGGFGVYYDNQMPMELGFVNAPSVFVQDSGAGIGVDLGLHQYVAVFEYKCFDGNSRWSRVSIPSALVLAASNDVNVEVLVPGVSKTPLQTLVDKTTVHIYRTSAGGITFHLVDSFRLTSTATTIGFLDQMSDSTLITRPLLFRQPLVAGSPVDRYHTLSTNCMVKHKDRVFYASGSTVYYSSFFVDGEAPWFAPEFFIYVPGGQGPITGLASSDGTLIVFKEDSVFLVDGDGPPENGGTGLEYTPPRRIQTEFGCIDQRSILQLPDGVMFRSNRGFELLGSNGRVKFVGENVSSTVDSNQFTCGAIFDRNYGRAQFLIAPTETAPFQYSGAVIASLDLTSAAWSIWKPVVEVQDLVYANVADVSTRPSVFYIGSDNDTVWCEFDGIRLDGANPIASPTYGGSYVSGVMTTGWIRSSMQNRIRVDELLVLARNVNNHDVKVSVAYDYSNTWVTTDQTVFEADNWVGEEIKQLCFQVPQPECQAIRFKIEDVAPSDTGSFPVVKGAGAEFMGLTVKLGIVGGGAKLSAKHKG